MILNRFMFRCHATVPRYARGSIKAKQRVLLFLMADVTGSASSRSCKENVHDDPVIFLSENPCKRIVVYQLSN